MFLVVIHTFIQPERVCRKFFGQDKLYYLAVFNSLYFVDLIDLACCRALNVKNVVICLCAASEKGVAYIE